MRDLKDLKKAILHIQSCQMEIQSYIETSESMYQKGKSKSYIIGFLQGKSNNLQTELNTIKQYLEEETHHYTEL